MFKRWYVPVAIVAFALLMLGPLVIAGCESMQPSETAAHALRVFCALKRSDIGSVLLTDQQREAGAIVCNAVGLPLGS
ncbi:hypothetical protein QF001_003757 [Paraburkholderia youngii]|uniref:hypothetical protein n=1 Tax=Paraburkholderia youngii TaxID=2782701 RepID=UPI003D1E7432